MTILADTRVNEYLFINTRKTTKLVWFHNISTK